jgi:hypothetical protein
MELTLRARLALSAAFASTMLAVFAAPALAAAPANDNLADAQPIGPTLPVTGVSGTTVDATAEAGEPSPTYLAFPFNSVWYSLAVPAAGDYADIVTVSTCGGSGYNGDYIDVYAVNGPGFDGLQRQNRFVSTSSCTFTFVVAQGTQYRIVVDRANDGGAPHTLSVTEWAPPAGAPANDDFADAQEIGPGLPIEGVQGSNIGASPEIGEPSHGYEHAYSSVWYALNVPAAGDYPDVVTVNTCQEFGGGNNSVAVYAVEGPGFDGLVRQAAAGMEQSCAFTFAVTEGTNYRIAVDNINGGEDFTLSVTAPSPPANDMFADRQVIPSALPQDVDGSTVDASSEPNEPSPSRRDPERSVWYEWTSDVDEPVKINVCESDSEFRSFSPAIAVYTSQEEDPTVSDLDLIAGVSNGRSCTLIFDPTDAASEARSAGTPRTYYIAVDGLDEEVDFNLKLALATPPPNDDFADRQTIPSALPQTVPGSTLDASAEAGEPSHTGEVDARRSVWYEWTTSADGPIKFDVCDADFEDAAIAVYVGDPVLEELDEVDSNHGQGCTLDLDLTGNTDSVTFYVAVDSGNEEGDFNLNLRVPSPPANDDFEDALDVGPGLPVGVDGTNVDATRQPDEPSPESTVHSVWYAWTPDATQTVTVHTCKSSFDSILAVYTGSSFEDLSEVEGENFDCPGSSRGQKVTFEAQMGTRYLIAVDGDREGTFTLGIQVPGAAPAMPTITGVSPDSGGDDNDPKVIGNAEAGSTVTIYEDPACEDISYASGTAAEFASPGIPVHVGDDTTTTFYARAANVDGESSCSATSVSYSEVTPDPAPAAPTFLSSTPSSGNDNDPELRGTAPPGSTVRIYTNPTCTSAVAGTGSAALFAGAGITVHVGDNTTTTFYATAQDADGTSACSSSSLSYQETTPSTQPPGGNDPGNTTTKCPKGKQLKNGKCVKKKKKKKRK